MNAPIPVESGVQQEWVEVAQGARLAWNTLTNVGEPREGSNAFTMNAFYPYERVDERARAYLTAALEHLLVWSELAAPLAFHPDQVVIHAQRPPYTLARAAIESSARAIWLLDCPDPLECSRRHLSLIRDDSKEHRKSKPDKAAKNALQRVDDEVVRRVAGVFHAAQIAPPNGHLWLIQQACRARNLELNADEVEGLWRAASASTHGMFWPQLELQ